MPLVSDGYEITVTVHHETDKAILVSQTGDKEDAQWVPKSWCEIEKTGKPAIWNITMSEAHAAEKGFI